MADKKANIMSDRKANRKTNNRQSPVRTPRASASQQAKTPAAQPTASIPRLADLDANDTLVLLYRLMHFAQLGLIVALVKERAIEGKATAERITTNVVASPRTAEPHTTRGSDAGERGKRMTKQELLAKAQWLETLEVDADGSWAEYLHAKAQGLRTLAVNAPEEEE